jgi:3-oxo-5alpha-steroid 4-dehydrogenase
LLGAARWHRLTVVSALSVQARRRGAARKAGGIMASTVHSAIEDLDTGATGAPLLPALVLQDPAAADWDLCCDLLVVGCGLAGAATALKAAEMDTMSITIVDRFEGGGSSQASGGVVYLGGNTRVQQEAGVSDSVAAMAEYLRYETGDVVSRQTVEEFCQDSTLFLPWLERHGVKFGGPLTEAKTSYPSTHYLYYSGNERLAACRAIAAPAPRGHRVKPMDGGDISDGLSGRDLMIPLKRELDRTSNVNFMRQTAARRLIVDAQGRVLGAEFLQIPRGSLAARLHSRLFGLSGNMMLATLGITRPLLSALVAIERRFARPIRILAKRGTVLACGGFGFNPRLLNEAAPLYRHIAPIGTIADDGSGIMLGASVGAELDRMRTVSAWRFLYPPKSWPKGILVSKEGLRLLNEEAYGSRTGEALFEQSEGRGWLILDEPLRVASLAEVADPKLLPFQKYALRAALKRYATTAPTIAELAEKIGLRADRLTATVEGYNSDISTGRPDAFDKSEELRRPLLVPPFTAVDLSCYNKLNPILGITVGGLKVDEGSGAVLNAQGQVIPDLYAAGRTAVGIASNYYVSGLSLADCVWSGWRAAHCVVANRTEAGERNRKTEAA